mgnify:CR=1 FL=1
MQLIGDISVGLARFVFGVDSEHESMDDISKKFVDRLCDSGGPRDEPQQPSDGNQLVDDAVLTFGEDGSSNAGFVKVTRTGVKKGVILFYLLSGSWTSRKNDPSWNCPD